jgi:hypothetical protein
VSLRRSDRLRQQCTACRLVQNAGSHPDASQARLVTGQAQNHHLACRIRTRASNSEPADAIVKKRSLGGVVDVEEVVSLEKRGLTRYRVDRAH